MQKTAATKSMPSPKRDVIKPDTQVGTDKSPSAVFIGMALDMSWRLAIVVLVPVIGGFKLDEHLGTTPLLTITGFLLAMAGMALVLWQMLQAVSKLPVPSAPKGNKEKKA